MLDMYVLPLMMVGSYYTEGILSDALDTYTVGVIFTASLSLQCQTFSFNRLINHLCHSLSIPSLKLLSKSSAAVFCQYLGVLTRECKFHYLEVAEPEKGLIGFNKHHSLWMLMKSNNVFVSKMDPRESRFCLSSDLPCSRQAGLDQAWSWPVCRACFTPSTFHFLWSWLPALFHPSVTGLTYGRFWLSQD